jgi:hypothetical protein
MMYTIQIYLYESLVPLKLSIRTSILSKGNLYLVVILFRTLEFVHTLHYPSLFDIINVGTMYRLMLSLINPFNHNSTQCFSTNSSYALLDMEILHLESCLSHVQSSSLVEIHLACHHMLYYCFLHQFLHLCMDLLDMLFYFITLLSLFCYNHITLFCFLCHT